MQKTRGSVYIILAHCLKLQTEQHKNKIKPFQTGSSPRMILELGTET